MSILNKSVKENLIGSVNLLKKVHGYSAYDLAVAHGFNGTEEEWLESLHGKDGEPGKKGDPGTLESHTEIDAKGHKVTNVAYPTESGDAVNLGYIWNNVVQSPIETVEVYVKQVDKTKPGEFVFDRSFFPNDMDRVNTILAAQSSGYSNYKCKILDPDELKFRLTNASTGEPLDEYNGSDVPAGNVTVRLYYIPV